MKFVIQSSDLLAMLTAASAVSKSPDPIQIIAERIGDIPGETPFDIEERPVEVGQVRIIAYTENMVAEWRRPAEIRMTGSVAIHPEGLAGLVRASKGSDATFSIDTIDTDNIKSLRLTTSRSSHEFPSVDDAVFSKITPGHAQGAMSNLSNLAQAIATARIALLSKAEGVGGRIAYTGVNLSIQDGFLHVAGTDGRRLALTTLKMSTLGSLDLGERPEDVTIPVEGLPLIVDMLNAPQSRLQMIDNNIVVENATGSFSIRIIDSPYPRYAALLKCAVPNKLAVAKSALEMALQRSSVLLARDKRAVAVKLSSGQEGIYITSAAAGQSSSECISDKPAEDFSIGFDAKYMTQAIGAFGNGEIELAFADERTPIQISSRVHPEIDMLIMPCKVA